MVLKSYLALNYIHTYNCLNKKNLSEYRPFHFEKKNHQSSDWKQRFFQGWPGCHAWSKHSHKKQIVWKYGPS